MTDKVTKVLEALVDGLEAVIFPTETAAPVLSSGEAIEVLEGLQVEIDDMLERLTTEIGEARGGRRCPWLSPARKRPYPRTSAARSTPASRRSRP